MEDTYKSISENSEGLFKDKGSKFIAYAYPIESEDEVKPILQTLKKEHYCARHHCYAFRLGAQGEKYRANDDGEPSGTAGRPILGQLLSNDLTNILVVIVRYFGGTLLGVSGLINAYKHATIDVLTNSTIVEHIVEKHYLLKFEYSLQNHVMKVVKDETLRITSSKYEYDCELNIAIRLNSIDSSLNKLSKIERLIITEME